MRSSAGRRAILRATNAITSDAMSEKLWSASAIKARLPDRRPPTICATVSSAFAQIAKETRRSPDVASMCACPWSCGIADLLLIMSALRTGNAGNPTFTDGAHPCIHPVPDDAAIDPVAEEPERLTMTGIERVGIIERSEIARDACLLDVGVFPRPFDRRCAQAVGSGAVSAETLGSAEGLLQTREEPAVENEAFKLDPPSAGPDLDPGMQDLRRCDGIDGLGHHAA